MWHAGTSPDGSAWGVDGNGTISIRIGAGVAVGADHHLHHCFKSPLWQERQKESPPA